MAWKHSTPLHLNNGPRLETSSLYNNFQASNASTIGAGIKSPREELLPSMETASMELPPMEPPPPPPTLPLPTASVELLQKNHVRKMVELFDLKAKAPKLVEPSLITTTVTPNIIKARLSNEIGDGICGMDVLNANLLAHPPQPPTQSNVQKLIEKLEKSLIFSDRCNPTTKFLGRHHEAIAIQQQTPRGGGRGVILCAFEQQTPSQQNQTQYVDAVEEHSNPYCIEQLNNERSPIINVTSNRDHQQTSLQSEFDTASEFSMEQVALPEEAMYKSKVKIIKTPNGVRFVVDINTFGTLDRVVDDSSRTESNLPASRF